MRIRTSGSRIRLSGKISSGLPAAAPEPGIGEIFRLYNNNSGAADQVTYTQIDGTEDSVTVAPLETRYILALSGSLSDNPSIGNFISDTTATNLLITSSNANESLTFTEELLTTTGAGTWTKPSGVTQVIVECWGGGGAGGGASTNNSAGNGAGGGGFARSLFIYQSAQQNISYNIGTGGTGGTGIGPNGQNTTWNSTDVIARGGQGGTGSFTGISVEFPLGGGNVDGLPNIGTITYSGGNGTSISTDTTNVIQASGPGGAGASSAVGGFDATVGSYPGVPFPNTPPTPGSGRNEYGGTGGDFVGLASLNGLAGTIYAAGGGGANKTTGANRSGGDGAQGLIRLIYR